jgi:hypothetical protein
MAIGESKLHELLRRRRLLSDAVEWLKVFDAPTKEMIVNWVRYDQLRDKGIDGHGEVIGYYSYVTELINPEKKANTPYTLEDTGAFYESMYLRVLSDAIIVEANPIKGQDNLYFKYGEEITGLTDENIAKLREVVKEKYINQFRKILFGN